ncbi:unnamed protein product [Prorocentrum cordatum]|uniref:Calpain catalytic domain-containing protein n=1 Tax=Prorocentrum cordatum TaxID=2364126 RepID=A0ABN9W7X3_9DINO|nr:unnamed protein product [Polarella glacialis]
MEPSGEEEKAAARVAALSPVSKARLARAQVERILEDPATFDFLCEQSFEAYDREGSGQLTLPDVFPMARGLLESLGRPANCDAVAAAWEVHCDKHQRVMSLEQFRHFLRALFKDGLDRGGAVYQDRSEEAHQGVRSGAASAGVQHDRSCTGVSPELAETRASQREDDGAARASLARAAAPEGQGGRGDGAPSAALGDGAPPAAAVPAAPPRPRQQQPAAAAQVTQDPRVTPTLSRPGVSQAAAGAVAWHTKPVAPEERAGGAALPPPLQDQLAEAFARLPPDAERLGRAARSAAAAPSVDLSSACFEGRPGVLTSLEAALARAYVLLGALEPTGLFEDADFGPRPSDPLGAAALSCECLPPEAAAPRAEDVAWLRPHEWQERGEVRFAGPLCAVEPGAFDNGWLASALGALALREPLLLGGAASGLQEPLGVFPRLFWDPEMRRRGLYCFRFTKHGQWLYVIIDDRLPCFSSSRLPLGISALRPDEGVPPLWAPLVEKAFAKLHGSYAALCPGVVDHALEDLTGWPTEMTRLPQRGVGGGGAPGEKSQEPSDDGLFESLRQELSAGSLLVCRAASSGAGAEPAPDELLVHVDADTVGLSGPTPFCTGVHRSPAYPVLQLAEVRARTGEGVRLVRLHDAAGFCGGHAWGGRWGDEHAAWRDDPGVADQLLSGAAGVPASGPHSLLPPRGRPRDCGRVLRRQALLDGGPGQAVPRGDHDGTFFMLFSDWLQVFGYLAVSRPLTPENGWAYRAWRGRWTQGTCGGTPLPICLRGRPAPLSTQEDWARNPQCRLALGGGEAAHVEVFATLQQRDARMVPGSTFPFDDRFHELFLSCHGLDAPGQRLDFLDKKRIVKPGGFSMISRRREVHLRLKLKAPGSYAFVPSLWEASIEAEEPFLLRLWLRCDPARMELEAPEQEGWEMLA